MPATVTEAHALEASLVLDGPTASLPCCRFPGRLATAPASSRAAIGGSDPLVAATAGGRTVEVRMSTQEDSIPMHRSTRMIAALGAAALLLPSAALAKSKPQDKPVKAPKSMSQPTSSTPVSWVFEGGWHIDGTVTVGHGNSRVRKGGYVGQIVAFDLTSAKLRVADTNGDGAITAADLLEGDKVVVKAKLPRDPGPQPFAARMVVDQTQIGRASCRERV